MRIVFMGTPDFAVPSLQKIIDAGHEVIAVVTQPDKPKGRGGQMQMSPVKELALEAGIPVYQPVKIRKDEEFMQLLEDMKPDVAVVVAFGQILPQRVLDIPKYGCLNVHGSLLPDYRGAAPVQWAVIDGCEKSGVTIMQMDAGLDTGDMLLKKEIVLDRKETGGSLFDKIALAGAELAVEALAELPKGTLKPQKQGEPERGYAKMLEKQLGELDFRKDAVELERLIRGLNPWPSAYTSLNGKTLKIWDANVIEEEALSDEERGCAPGSVCCLDRQSFGIRCGSGALKICELQLEGKKRMNCADFMRGYEITKGIRF